MTILNTASIGSNHCMITTSNMNMGHRLWAAGHSAYFVGGWVRDALLCKPSADIDIATSASVMKEARVPHDLCPAAAVSGWLVGPLVKHPQTNARVVCQVKSLPIDLVRDSAVCQEMVALCA
jgi:hypothetical protein